MLVANGHTTEREEEKAAVTVNCYLGGLWHTAQNLSKQYLWLHRLSLHLPIKID